MERIGIAALERAIIILGGQGAAGTACGVGQSTISECLRNGKKVPAEWCIPLERATAAKGHPVPRHEFRPDLYPLEDDAPLPVARQRESRPPNHSRGLRALMGGG